MGPVLPVYHQKTPFDANELVWRWMWTKKSSPHLVPSTGPNLRHWHRHCRVIGCKQSAVCPRRRGASAAACGGPADMEQAILAGRDE